MYKYLIYYKINVSKDSVNECYSEYNAIIDGNESGPSEVDIIKFRFYCKEHHNTESNPIIINIMKLK